MRKTNLLLGAKLHSCLAKYENHTLNTLLAHIPTAILYLLHYSSNSVVILIALQLPLCFLIFNLLLPDIPLPIAAIY